MRYILILLATITISCNKSDTSRPESYWLVDGVEYAPDSVKIGGAGNVIGFKGERYIYLTYQNIPMSSHVDTISANAGINRVVVGIKEGGYFYESQSTNMVVTTDGTTFEIPEVTLVATGKAPIKVSGRLKK